MMLRDALVHARNLLNTSNIEDAPLEAEVLLRYLLKVDRTFLFSNPDLKLSEEQRKAYDALIQRRCSGEPSAYITGVREFYGLDFRVNPSVLIPRSETELLIDEAVKAVKKHGYTKIADIGTGSGCIAVTLAVQLPAIHLFAVDTSGAALETAKVNAAEHTVSDRITLLKGELLEPLSERVDMIVANLPYINENDIPSVNTRGFEPESALYGGPDGLDFIKRLIDQSREKLASGGTILLEIGYDQAEAVKSVLDETYPGEKSCVLKDLAGIDRVVIMTLSRNTRLFS